MSHQSEQLLTALEGERSYVARELHDGVAQTTLQLSLQAGICRKLLEAGKLDKLAKELAQLEEHSQLANTQVRQMIGEMRAPTVEAEATLDEYIQHLVDRHAEQGGGAVSYQFGWADEVPQFSKMQTLALVRIIQEALLNIRKHAKARNVRLSLSSEEDNLYVTIADDGQGFDPAEVSARPADKGGAGLINMQTRAEALEGELTITRDTIGAGTKVTLVLPK